MYEIRPFNRKGFIVAAFFVLTIASVQFAYSQASENVIIDRNILRLAKSGDCLEAEYTAGRPTLRGDVNGDGKADVVVLYTIEGCGGGMNWAQGLAVFLRKGRSIQFATETNVGAKGIRTADLKSISGGRINLDTMTYRPDDGACCPSREGKTKYVFSKGKLREAAAVTVSTQSLRTQDAELNIGTLEENAEYFDAIGWCSFKSASANSKADIFFINLEETPYKFWLNINGRVTALKLVSSTPTNVLRLKRGSRYTERYRSEDITAEITYVVVKRLPEGTAHTATVVVMKGNQSKTVKAVGECGG